MSTENDYSKFVSQLHSPEGESQPRKPWRVLIKHRKLVLAVMATVVVAGTCYVVNTVSHDRHVRRIEALANDPARLVKAVQSNELSAKDRGMAVQKAHENAMAEAGKQLDEYFALKTPAERRKMMDVYIDQMQAARRQWEAQREFKPPAASAARPQVNQQTDRNAAAKMMQSIPPARLAQFAQAYADFMKRLKERGIAVQ